MIDEFIKKIKYTCNQLYKGLLLNVLAYRILLTVSDKNFVLNLRKFKLGKYIEISKVSF